MSVVPQLVPQSLKPYNTFQIEHSCAELIHAKTNKDLVDTCLRLYSNNKPFLVLGGGSNIVLVEDYAGTVVRVETQGFVASEDENYHYLDVQAGESWHELVKKTLSLSIPGLENLALIPGTVGASPIQNIGAYGVELMDVCDWVEYADLKTGTLIKLSAADCHFGYRDSIFKQELKSCSVITSVGFRLAKAWVPVITYGPLKYFTMETVTPKKIFDCICKLRSEKLPDPEQMGNAGSFFKNPIIPRHIFDDLKSKYPDIVGYFIDETSVKIAAGWLIDNAGLKGARVGEAAVHENQALVLINLGNATGQDVVLLATDVINCVHTMYGIRLEPEPRLIGTNGEKELLNG